MLLAHPELLEMVERGYIDAMPENVNAASVDLRLGNKILVEDCDGGDVFLWDKKSTVKWREIEIPPEGFCLCPGQFILASTVEIFNLPNDLSGMFILRSSMARNGLEHLQAGWADAGFHDAHLTLEFQNVCRWHRLWIRPGMRVGQMVMFRHSDSEQGSYAKKGNYNGQKGPTESQRGA